MSRYIDADEFYVSQVARCWGEPIIGTCTSDNALLYDELKKLPTSDVAEVIHGEWILVDGDVGYSVYQCSKCGGKVVLDDEGGVYDYCPHCGAKMDGERKDA